MKKIGVIIVIFFIISSFYSCAIFDGLIENNIYLVNMDTINTSIKEVALDNYLITADIPDVHANEQVSYKLKVYNKQNNHFVSNSEISLIILEKKKHHHRRTNHPVTYTERVRLKFEEKKEESKEFVFMYEYDAKRKYKLNFEIISIDGKDFEKPLNVIAYHQID